MSAQARSSARCRRHPREVRSSSRVMFFAIARSSIHCALDLDENPLFAANAFTTFSGAWAGIVGFQQTNIHKGAGRGGGGVLCCGAGGDRLSVLGSPPGIGEWGLWRGVACDPARVACGGKRSLPERWARGTGEREGKRGGGGEEVSNRGNQASCEQPSTTDAVTTGARTNRACACACACYSHT